MTYREKLIKEHPDRVDVDYAGQCVGCPEDYGYEKKPRSCDNRGSCSECWDREIPDDPVNHPAHYTAGGIECIDAIASALTCQKDPVAAWLTGQVIKYLWRWPLKNGAEDLEKARFYLNRLIERESK